MARPSKGNTEKFTIYLSPELSQKMKDLAHFQRRNISDLINDIAQKYVADNEQALKIFHDAIAQAEQVNKENPNHDAINKVAEIKKKKTES